MAAAVVVAAAVAVLVTVVGSSRRHGPGGDANDEDTDDDHDRNGMLWTRQSFKSPAAAMPWHQPRAPDERRPWRIQDASSSWTAIQGPL